MLWVEKKYELINFHRNGVEFTLKHDSSLPHTLHNNEMLHSSHDHGI